MLEICVMEEGGFEVYQGEAAQRLLDSGKVYLCQCDEETAPDYFAHFDLAFIDAHSDDYDAMWREIEQIARGGG